MQKIVQESLVREHRGQGNFWHFRKIPIFYTIGMRLYSFSFRKSSTFSKIINFFEILHISPPTISHFLPNNFTLSPQQFHTLAPKTSHFSKTNQQFQNSNDFISHPPLDLRKSHSKISANRETQAHHHDAHHVQHHNRGPPHDTLRSIHSTSSKPPI